MLDFSFLILPEILIEDRDYADCKTGLGVVKGIGATGTAVGGIAIGFLCAATFGIGCVAAAAGIGAATLAGTLLDEKVCGTKPESAELTAIKRVNDAVKKMSEKLDTIGGDLSHLADEVKKLGTIVQFTKYQNKIREVEHAYKDIRLDQNGLVATTGRNPYRVKQFVNEVLYTEPRLTISLDRIFDMIKGRRLTPSMYKQAYFCQQEVKQYYNMLFLEGYQLLYIAYALKGWKIEQHLMDKERDRILQNNHLFWTVCGK